jgi:DnaJ-domain-containing protein 1
LLKWVAGQYSSGDERAYSGGSRSHQGERSKLDPYAVLGLKANATKEEIRAAYRDLMTKYHPDKVAHLGVEFQEIAKTKALELNRAYQMLHR